MFFICIIIHLYFYGYVGSHYTIASSIPFIAGAQDMLCGHMQRALRARTSLGGSVMPSISSNATGTWGRFAPGSRACCATASTSCSSVVGRLRSGCRRAAPPATEVMVPEGLTYL